MVKKISILLLALIPFVLKAQRKAFSVQGQFSTALSGKVYYTYNEAGISVKDSALVNNGKFELNGNLLGVQKAYITFSNGALANENQSWKDFKSLYLEPGTIRLLADSALSTSKILGSAINTEYDKYIAPLNAIAQERKLLLDAFNKLTKASQKDVQGLELKRKLEEKVQQRELVLRQYVAMNPRSYFSIEAVIELMGPYVAVDKVEQLWAGLDPVLKQSYNGKMVDAVLKGARATDIGSRAPAFTQPDTAGNAVSLLSSKGKYVFIDFWASWCHPCRAENPNVLKAYQNYRDKNFVVIGISIDFEKDKEKWLKAIHEDGMPWTQLLSPGNIDGGAMKAYGIRAIPSNFLVDPNGIIIAKNLRGEELHRKLAEIL